MLTLLNKEWLESWRTYRTAIVWVVLFAFGLLSPLLARYTPELVRSVPDLPPGFAELVPDPTIQDAIAQYVENVSLFGVLLVIVVSMGSVAGERERGSAVLLLTKPLRPALIILTKWIVGMGVLLVGVLLAGLACWFYTWILFEPLDLGASLVLNTLLYVVLGFYLTLAILASSLAPTQMMASAGAFGLLVVSLVLGALPGVGELMPAELLAWGRALFVSSDGSSWSALLFTLALTCFSLTLACLYWERVEI